MSKEYLTAQEVADKFAMSRMTIYKFVRNGHIPYSKFGGAVRFNSDSILAWEKKHQVNPSSMAI